MKPPRTKKKSKKIIPLADEDNFEDIEDNDDDSLKVDMESVSHLLKAFEEEGPCGGPVSSLFASLNINPSQK